MRLLSNLMLLILSLVAHAQPEDDAALQSLRVMGGTAVAPGEFPSTVALHRKKLADGTPAGHRCGGTVIAPRWVLTAAHCVFAEPGRSTVASQSTAAFVIALCGSRNSSLPCLAPQPATDFVIAEPRDFGTRLAAGTVRLIQVDTVIVHPGYALHARRVVDGIDVIAAPNDIALLRLQGDSTRPSQLLAGGADREVLEQPQRGATIVGFGQTMKLAPPSADLLSGVVPIAPIERCCEGRRPTLAGIEDLIGPTQLCAGFKGGKVDACHGDSGRRTAWQYVTSGQRPLGVRPWRWTE